MSEDLKKIEERIKKLREVINHHRELYHVYDKQEISDEALDSLKYELTTLEQKYPQFITPDSPTQRVAGRPLEKFEKVKHKVPQWSFNDAFSEEDIRDFDTRVKRFLQKSFQEAELLGDGNVEYICELKIDGFKIVLEYEKGLLKTATTRGDGVVGENVTANVRTIESIPLRLKENVDLIAEGEIWMGKKGLEKINKEQIKRGQEPFANPRNLAAGTIRQLDPRIVAERKLENFAYDISSASFSVPETQEGELKRLMELGFKVNKNFRLCKNIDEVISYWKEWQKKANKEDYWIDGVVLKVNSRKYQEILGYTGKAPRFGIAFKFRAEQATTILEDIKVQVGRTGVLTPVAYLKPVQIAGSTVSRATLHNEDEIKRLDVRIGDTVILQKAGDVIPNILSVIKEMRTGKEKIFKMPKECPVCGTDVVRVEGEVAYKCPNKKCFAKERRKMYYFVGKAGFNIDGLGPKVIDLLADNELISSPIDIFDLTKEDVETLPRMGEKSAENLVNAINLARNVALPKFITSLGIEGVGEETAYDLAKHFGSIEKLRKATLEELRGVYGIGEITAESVFDWFKEASNIKIVDELIKRVKIVNEQISRTVLDKKLVGKTFVFTGTMPTLDREEGKKMVRDNGGDVSESVSAKTDYLVAGENAGSKYRRASELGIKIINEEEFLKMVGI
ncbi:MAG: ligase protein [Candidatus Nomurabacteria bacterium GW2011_GWF2_35_66]|nr:MAG: ligase protein [Candidatus Nomurabacteria bacterium GW2011_GWF2_35_66]HBM45411.1 NAD-dependent DNA ligase LigA [Patescibacteria group bacterium]